MCAKFGCGPTVVSKKGVGTDRQTDKGTLQLYIVDWSTDSVDIEWSRMFCVPAITTDGWMKRTLVTREHWTNVDNESGIFVFGK